MTEFRAELTEIRNQGYARSAGERVLGITAIAAPIMDSSGAVQGALGLTGPSDELSGEQAQRIVPELAERQQLSAPDTPWPPDPKPTPQKLMHVSGPPLRSLDLSPW